MNQRRAWMKAPPSDFQEPHCCCPELLLGDIIRIGKKAELLLQKFQESEVISACHCNQRQDLTKNRAGGTIPSLEPETNVRSNNRNEHDSPLKQTDAAEIDMFDDDSLWPKAQMKQFMFAGHVSSREITQIEKHRENIKPIYDKDKDCGICLLEMMQGANHSIYVMPCCRAKVHLECIFRCLGSRAIQNKCPACVKDIRDDAVKEVVRLMKSEKRRVRELRKTSNK